MSEIMLSDDKALLDLPRIHSWLATSYWSPGIAYELVKRAVQFNADARVTSYQPAIDQARVVEAEAAFDWKFFSNTQYVHQDDLFPTAEADSFPEAVEIALSSRA